MYLMQEEHLQKAPAIDESAIDNHIVPRDRLLSMSPEEFEEFVCEWLTFKKIYNNGVYRIGQAGDKGRDVIGYDSGEVDYYQCKRYKERIMPSEFWLEFGKLVFFTHIGDIPKPRAYKIVAPMGGGSTFLDIIKDDKKLKEGLRKNWESKCSTNIVSNKKIELSEDLDNYIEQFDFSIVELVDMSLLLLEYSETPLFFFRFGGPQRPARSINVNFTDTIEDYEAKYIEELLYVYSEKEGYSVTKENIIHLKNIKEDFNENRSYFFSAESLNRSLRDILSTNEEFDNLKDEIYSGVSSYAKRKFTFAEDKMNEILHEATKTDLRYCISYRYLNFVKNDDKKGICHHLVNEGRITWFEK